MSRWSAVPRWTERENIRAHRLGVMAVVQRRRVRVALDGLLVYDGVDLVGRDARTNGGGSNIEDFSCQLDGGSGVEKICRYQSQSKVKCNHGQNGYWQQGCAGRLRAERRRRARNETHSANIAHLLLLLERQDPGRVSEFSVLGCGETCVRGGEEDGERRRTHMVR